MYTDLSLISLLAVKMIQGRPITLNLTSGKTVLLPSTALKKSQDQQATDKTDPNVSLIIHYNAILKYLFLSNSFY